MSNFNPSCPPLTRLGLETFLPQSTPNPSFDKEGGKGRIFVVGNIVGDAIHSRRGVIRYWPELKDVARINRKNPTKAEEKIWNEVLSKRKTGFLFLRQKPLYRFVADFYCSELSLVVEVDGDSHDNKKGTDGMRDRWLECIGIKTIRFTNKEILENIEKVKSVLKVSLVKGRFRGIESPNR